MRQLAGKVALVTGGTQGLGEGIALSLAEAGARIVINGRDANKAPRVLEALRALGVEAHFVRADVGQRAAAVALVNEAARYFGRLDILINNAQDVPPLIDSADPETDAAFDRALRSGLLASLWTAQAALPYFQAAGGGRIVNFGSINGVYGSKYGAAYNATKEAIHGLTKTMANEWGRFKVTVNTVLPAGISPAYEAFYRNDPRKADAVARLNPMRRHGRAREDIGAAVRGLVSEHAKYITGQALFVDGGANLLGLPQLHRLESPPQST